MTALDDSYFFQFCKNGEWEPDRYLYTDYAKCLAEAKEFKEETGLPVRIIADANRIEWESDSNG